MKKRVIRLAAFTLTALMSVAQAATVTVAVVDDGVSNIGAPGTFYWAITNANAGDTIAFAIPGDGPHYLQIPPEGFPIIYRKHNLTIDGFTQGSATGTTTDDAKPNTNPITAANNAVMKIVIDGRTGGARNMQVVLFGTTVVSDPPIDNSAMSTERNGLTGIGESALLGIYRSTNVNVRGLAFLGKILTSGVRQKGIVICHDYDLDTNVLPRNEYYSGSSDGFHLNGCWIGVNPTNPTVAGAADQGFRVSITSYRHEDAVGGARPMLINSDMTIGVKKGSLNPRAEFNVMAGVGGFLSTDSLGLRVSGNFISVLPDGVTPFNFITDSINPGQFRGGWFDVGCRQNDELQRPMVIGTDGDGVNDADEGNLFGPLALNASSAQLSLWGFFNTMRNPFICAGNRIGIANDGTIWPNNSCYISTFRMDQGTQVRFGSDFNGVSDDLEANVIYGNNVFGTLYPTPATRLAPSLFRVMDNIAATDGWFSFRGNKLVNNFPIYNPNNVTADDYTNTWNTYVPDVDNKVPVLSASTVSTLNGTCNAPANDATNLIVDVYLPDPEGQVNGAAFDYPFFGGLAGAGFVQGKTHLGSFLDNGPYDSNPAVGAFSLNIAGLGLAHGTKVTVAVTYSKWALPNITSLSRSGSNATLSWTGDNGGPYNVPGVGGPTSGFGVQSAASITGPWTTTFAPSNSITLAAAGSTGFYRIVAPISGMTTLCADPVVLP